MHLVMREESQTLLSYSAHFLDGKASTACVAEEETQKEKQQQETNV